MGKHVKFSTSQQQDGSQTPKFFFITFLGVSGGPPVFCDVNIFQPQIPSKVAHIILVVDRRPGYQCLPSPPQLCRTGAGLINVKFCLANLDASRARIVEG